MKSNPVVPVVEVVVVCVVEVKSNPEVVACGKKAISNVGVVSTDWVVAEKSNPAVPVVSVVACGNEARGSI